MLAVSEQLPGERYRIGQHLKAYVLEVRRTTRGPVIVASRTHRGFLRRLMEMEIPEIYNGTVVIRGIAREAGSRSKVAVESRQAGVDAEGRGGRQARRADPGDRRRAQRREGRRRPLERGPGAVRRRGASARPRC